jgi:K+/H+ antiporter YhaU regulatory subunit KhtT
MRKLKVGHEQLPGIGDLYEITPRSGGTLTVVAHRSGRRDLIVGTPDDDRPPVTVELSRSEATAVATLLAGVHIELSMSARD